MSSSNNDGAKGAPKTYNAAATDYDYSDILRQLQSGSHAVNLAESEQNQIYRTHGNHRDQSQNLFTAGHHDLYLPREAANTDDYRTGETLGRLNHQHKQPVELVSSSQTSGGTGRREASGDKNSKRQQRQQQQMHSQLHPQAIATSSRISSQSRQANNMATVRNFLDSSVDGDAAKYRNHAAPKEVKNDQNTIGSSSRREQNLLITKSKSRQTTNSRNATGNDFITFNDQQQQEEEDDEAEANARRDPFQLQQPPISILMSHSNSLRQRNTVNTGVVSPSQPLAGLMSSVTSSELIATINDQQVVLSPPGIMQRSYHNEQQRSGSPRKSSSQTAQQLVYSPTSPSQAATSQQRQAQPKHQQPTNLDAVRLEQQQMKQHAENIAPNSAAQADPLPLSATTDYQQLASCERDLQDLAKLRLKTLEEIIQDKLLVIEQLQNENQAERSEKAKVIEQVRERQSVISNYESRFLQVRAIIEKQDAELRVAHKTLDDMRGQLENEEAKGRRLQEQMESAELQSRTNLQEMQARVEQNATENTDRFKKQLLEFEQKLAEKDKWLEAMQIRNQADLQQLADSKDKEISALQEQLQSTYRDMAQEIETLQQKILEITHDNELKIRMSSQQLVSQGEQHKLLNEHISKLQGIIQSKTEVCQGLDEQNATLLQELQEARQAATQAQTELIGFKGQSQDELLHMRQQLAEARQDHENGLTQVARDHEREKRQLERANKKTVKQFEKIREQVKDKERTVKLEIERVLAEWEQKCLDLEEQVQESKTQVLLAENASKQSAKDAKFAQKEQKTMREVIRAKEEEIRTLQRKYEDELEKKSDLRVEEQAKHKQVQDKLQFEIDFLKKELEQQMRGREMQYQYQQRRNIAQIAAPTSSVLMNNFTIGDAQAAQHQTISSGNGDPDKLRGPSPYLAQFVRSNYKQTGGPSLNDSLDKLKLDFMHGYNEAMAESDAAYRLDTQKKRMSSAAGGRVGALQQMLVGGQSHLLSGNQANGNGAGSSLELQLTKEENEALKKVIEQMKIDMETIVDKVKSTFNEQLQQQKELNMEAGDPRKVRELESKLASKEEQIQRLKEERDRLIQISNDLRADLNRSQRLVNDLMNREMSAHQNKFGSNNVQTTPDEKKKHYQSLQQQQESMPTPMGMFDPNMRMSVEDQFDNGGGQSQSPALRKHATFGEGQMNLQDSDRPDARFEQILKNRQQNADDPRKSTVSRVFDPNGSEHDKILEYGAQLNDIALQLQEWVSIYQSQGSNGGNPLFSINSKHNRKARAGRPVQKLTYAADGQLGITTAFGTREAGMRSSRSLGSTRQSRMSGRLQGSPGSRSHSRWSHSRSASRSKSREGRKFIQKIEKLRKNLEVEGRAIQTYYRQADEQKKQKVQQSEKMTASQYKAANQILMKQNREMKNKQASVLNRDKDKKEIRKQMIENARGKVMNYALKKDQKDIADSDSEGDNCDDKAQAQLIAVDEETQELLTRHDPSNRHLFPAADHSMKPKQHQATFNADIGQIVNEQPIQIHPLHLQRLAQQQQHQQNSHQQQSMYQGPSTSTLHQVSQHQLYSTPNNNMQAGYHYNEDLGGVDSTLHLVPSTVKTADINLDHDIAGEFEAAIDHSKLESKNKYDFMNLHEKNPSFPQFAGLQGDGGAHQAHQQYSPFSVDGQQQSAIRPLPVMATANQNNNMRATGSIMGDLDSRASSSFIVSTPHYN